MNLYVCFTIGFAIGVASFVVALAFCHTAASD